MITKDTLISCGVTYNPDTGIIDGRSCWYDEKGYLLLKVCNKKYRAHQIAFVWMENRIPEQIDHLDRVKDNNKWNNLEETTSRKNSNNRNRRSKFGPGVYWKMGKFQSEIIVEGKRNILGRYSSIHKANRIRCLADINIFGNYEESWV